MTGTSLLPTMVILAGGLGTRLQGAVADRPKVLAPVAGRPFLAWMLAWLAAQGIARVRLALGYRARQVTDLAANSDLVPAGLDVDWRIEAEPLGTAGGLAHALDGLAADPVLAMNGDTFVLADLAGFVGRWTASGLDAGLVGVRVEDRSAYGALEVDDAARVCRFVEKGAAAGPGWINGGLYGFRGEVLADLGRRRSGSLERDVLEGLAGGGLFADCQAVPFLDIGTPAGLAAAEMFVGRHLAPPKD